MGKKRATRDAAASTPLIDQSHWLSIVGATQNNLKNLTVHIPLGRFVCVTGVSGSGKSSLINDILYEALLRDLNESESASPGLHERIEGLEHLDKVINIDQSPIGRTPRSNPATYIKVFDEIRDLFTRLPDAKVRGYKPGRFSFNVSTGKAGGGRCESCEGYGSNKMEMEFLADVWVTCPICNGKRFNHETLQILYKGKNISEVLDMDIQQALEHFENVPTVANMLRTLHDVGLDYLKLGQSSTTLSGGEAQRIKLARELVKRSTGRTMYLLDEPTTGLHFEDISKLLAVLHGFVDAGNSVVVIEHNTDVIKTADWVIDLGPEGGAGGGRIVVEGTPEEVAACEESFTGAALRHALNGKTNEKPKSRKVKKSKEVGSNPNGKQATTIEIVGARQNNLKGIDVSIPRGQMTVCCGPSGSGKSSFAVDTVYVEGQRRYVESLSAYARQFLGRFQPAKVDHIHGLSPAICIEQRSTSRSPRSTVGTVTEIYDYMRVLWARIGQPHCPKCHVPVGAQSADDIVEKLLSLGDGARLLLLAPIEPVGQEKYGHLLKREQANGYVRARVDGVVCSLDGMVEIDEKRRHKVELVVDRVVINRKQRARLTDSVEQALRVGQGVMLVQRVDDDGQVNQQDDSVSPGLTLAKRDEQKSRGPKRAARAGDMRFSQHHACERCGESYEELTPHHFSFNSRLGWCESCEGLGVQKGASPSTIVQHPTKSILDGAVAGWGKLESGSHLHSMILALADHIGFDAQRPWLQLTEQHRQRFLQGCGDDWIETSKRPNVQTSKRGRQSDISGRLRFKWRGFYPAIHRATQLSLQYRSRLDSMVVDVPCGRCFGSRLRRDAAAVRVGGTTIHEICSQPMGGALEWFESIKLSAREKKVAGELLHEIRSRLRFLVEVGLHYISLHRSAATLSGGESQRIQLASQIGTGLTGVLYVLDEPTIGLHPRDNRRLIGALKKLRDLGNTLLLVEHDREVIDASNHVLDFGPGAGSFGGEVTAAASPAKIRSSKTSLTGDYLSSKKSIAVPTNRRVVPQPPSIDLEQIDNESKIENAPAESNGRAKSKGKNKKVQLSPSLFDQLSSKNADVNWLTVHGARENNLKEVSVSFPLGRFTCVTGVSGSGKSTLVTSILCDALLARIHRASTTPGAHERITGVEHIDKVINVDQSPIGFTPTSNPATYTGVFDVLRELFAKLPLSKMRGYTANRFSFNRAGGRCEACLGMGSRCIEMHFLPDVWVECENCKGKRYTAETLEVQYKDKSIADVLEMRVTEAIQLLENVPKLKRLLQTLDDVGLGYVQLGQSATTLSGGEAQRVKLATELGRPSTGKTLYILDEPTTGLHFDDLKKLMAVLHRLVDLGNTCICIEHNLDVIKTADWVIDLGPEGGEAGGNIVVEGTPETVAKTEGSFTGVSLLPVLEAGPHEAREVFDPHKKKESPGAGKRRGKGEADDNTAIESPSAIDSSPRETSDRTTSVSKRKKRSDGLSVDDAGTQMPWDKDGRAWHTVNALDSTGQPVNWDVKVLEWLVDTIETLGPFEPANWNFRTKVEILTDASPAWFCHILTGGKELLEVSIRTAEGTFREREVQTLLGIKTLDERTDLPIYGQYARVKLRPVSNGWQEVRLMLRDFKDVEKAAFKKFLTTAAKAYFSKLEIDSKSKGSGLPWVANGERWHLSQEAINKKYAIEWKPATLMTLIGRFKSIEPTLEIGWDGKVMVRLYRPEAKTQHIVRIVTNMPQGLRVEIRSPSAAITPTMIERLGADTQIKRGPDYDWVAFWIRSIDDNDSRQLRDVWMRCRENEPSETARSA